ncbi:MAG: hypothetical protein C4527_08670 [Candidatus Omnitrophota bacterium]|nr:MAG: hypothetical protein C4527_08670 [Candidatus Omnitrophota bacterium]
MVSLFQFSRCPLIALSIHLENKIISQTMNDVSWSCCSPGNSIRSFPRENKTHAQTPKLCY